MKPWERAGWRGAGGIIWIMLVAGACSAQPGSGAAPANWPTATPVPLIQQVTLERASVRAGDADRLVVTLHSPGSGPASVVTVLSYPDGSQATVQGTGNGQPLELAWTVPAGMDTGTARYDVVVSQVCGCGTATSATWGDARGSFQITR